MTRPIARIVLLLWLAAMPAIAIVSPEPAAAQEVAVVARAPRFFMAPAAPGGAPIEVDAARVPTLRRKISLELDGVRLVDALEAVAREAGIRLVYVRSVLPIDSLVEFRSKGITVAAALTELLLGLRVDVMVSGTNHVALVRSTSQRVAPGSIVGRVTDAKTAEGLGGAEVLLDGTRWRTTTTQDGRYRLAEVAPGNYTLTIRRLGYGKQSRVIAVAEGAEVTVEVALQPVATQLNEIVTTVTGDQRRVELGHVVGRINADSVVKEAPVSNLSELLTGRVSGLQVFQAAGTVGGEVHLQSRGANSLLLSTEPIIVVDGVRYTSSSAQRVAILGSVKGETTSPLNDLDPNDIETVEVVKGPSAATLYGTDAANGVLVITTKRGHAGPARWKFHGIGSRTEVAKGRFPMTYWGYGRVPSNNQPYPFNCTLSLVAAGTCAQDSVVAFPNPLDDPEFTLFKGEPRWETGASLAGGLGDLRYYFSGNYENATGPIRMPKAIAEELTKVRGELPEEVLRPNTLNKLNLRANMAALLGRQLDLHVNAGYTRNATRAIQANTSNSPYVLGITRSRPGDAYDNGQFGPVASFSRQSTEAADRFIANANTQWRPVPWLLARAQVGLDLSQRNHYGLVRRGELPGTSPIWNNGVVETDRVRQLSTTGDVGVTATGRLGRISARTAVGAQYVRRLDDGLFSLGRDMPPGGTSVGEGAIRDARQSYAETVTLGTFLEETIGLNDRLFLTGALRLDGASAFGRDYDATMYPKVSASWLISEEPFLPRLPGLHELRLRYAFGASGQQPLPAWARPSLVATTVYVDGAVTTVVGVNALGNPNLRPERVSEHEFGFDVGAIGKRLQAGLTWYDRRTTNQIHSMPLPTGLGSIYTNLGLTTQSGFEADVTVQVVDAKVVSWNLSYQYGSHHTELVDLGNATAVRHALGGWAEGYSLGARFRRPILGYGDLNADGILTAGEVQRGDTAVYVGEGIPPHTQSLTTAVGLLNRRVRLSALFERRSGYVLSDELKGQLCRDGRCRAAVDPSTPLAEQAEVVGYQLNEYFQPGDFTRLREVTLAIDVPARLARALRARSATVSIAGRNLALWSAFDGPDPEVASVQGVRTWPAWGIPLGQTWTVRFDLGY